MDPITTAIGFLVLMMIGSIGMAIVGMIEGELEGVLPAGLVFFISLIMIIALL